MKSAQKILKSFLSGFKIKKYKVPNKRVETTLIVILNISATFQLNQTIFL